MRRHIIFLLLATVVAGCATHGEKRVIITEGGEARAALPSTYVPLEDLGNAHALREDGRILRGAAPETRVEKLKAQGVTDVLIFRDGMGRVVDNEKNNLRRIGYADQNIHHIPMPWRNLPSFEEACRNTIAALKVMQTIEADPNKKLYFHCTMGEDRTGMIAGLYRMVFQGWTAKRAYQQEMCAHGFAESNPRKPKEVAAIINADLKPVFARMAALAESRVLRPDHLNASICSANVQSSRVNAILTEKCF